MTESLSPDSPDGGNGEDSGSSSSEGTVSWRELHDEALARLVAADIDDSLSSARRIVEQAAGFEPVEFSISLDQLATVRGVAHLDAMVARRLLGEPLQYVVGSWGFRSLDLAVDKRVLIPRPETEEVVQWGMEELPRIRGGGTTEPLIVDLGTGSGAIGLSFLAEQDKCQVWLSDASADALNVARANLVGLGSRGASGRIVHGSWFDPLPDALRGSVSLIVTNPPYVAEADELPPVVADWEPNQALVSGPDGTEDVLYLLSQAPRWLATDGAVVIEMAPSQVSAMAEFAVGRFDEVETRTDLSGRDRAVIARYPTRSQ